MRSLHFQTVKVSVLCQHLQWVFTLYLALYGLFYRLFNYCDVPASKAE